MVQPPPPRPPPKKRFLFYVYMKPDDESCWPKHVSCLNEIQFYNAFVGVFECVLIYVTFTKHSLILFVNIIT